MTYSFTLNSVEITWLSVNEATGKIEGSAPSDSVDTDYEITMSTKINGKDVPKTTKLMISVEVCTVANCYTCTSGDMAR